MVGTKVAQTANIRRTQLTGFPTPLTDRAFSLHVHVIKKAIISLTDLSGPVVGED